MKSIPSGERAKVVRDLNFDDQQLPAERALGMRWSAEHDTFGFKIEMKEKPPTRRGILWMVSSLFDPLGLVGPVVLEAKQLLQTLCQMKLGWDDEIPQELSRKWHNWQEELPKLSAFEINRCLKPEGFENSQNITLHHFTDASEKGYGTVSYLRMTNEENQVSCALVMSKARVAPLKKVSIPRMELTAATVAVRVDHRIKQELELAIDDTYYWTDSQTVLKYIRSESGRFQTFVANRIAVIRDGSDSKQWHYVESSINPADACSRGMQVDKFLQMKSWREGPLFLQSPESDWPTSKELSPEDEAELMDELEIKKSSFAGKVVGHDEALATTLKLIHHYSDWVKLKRAVCWMRKFLRWMVEKGMEKSTLTRRLSLKEMQEGEICIIRCVQREAFAQEIGDLTISGVNQEAKRESRGKGAKKGSAILQLDPQLQEGVLRVGGRLSKGAMPTEAKHHTTQG